MKSGHRSRSILIAAFLAALVVPAVAISSGQQTVRVESSFVQMDATVTDKDGKRIHGLTSENFRILEDGKQQKLTGVDFFDVSKVSTTEKVEPIYISLDNPNDSETLGAIRSSHRLIVLFFDKSAMFPEDLIRAVDSAKEFVKNQMTPADLVTIATYGTQLIVKSDFTNDRKVLDETLDSLIPGKKTMPAGTKATLDDSITGDSGITDTEHSLSATTALAQMLAQIPGRKSVIHFTGGLSPGASLGGRGGGTSGIPMDRGVPNLRAGPPPIGPDINPSIDAATNAANDSNASFYEVDARGLITIGANDVPSACAHVTGRTCRAVHPSRDTLYTLAADSGGMLFTDLNDFRPIYKAVQDDSTGYYLLTFDPSNKKKDGSYRQIEIKLVNVPGGRITFRHGYYAPRK